MPRPANTIPAHRFVALCAVAATAAAAQQSAVAPVEYTVLFAGNNGSGTGIAAQTDRSHLLYPAPFAVGRSVRSVAFRRAASLTATSRFQIDCELGLSSTVKTAATLDPVYANNFGSAPTVTSPRRLYDFPSYAADDPPDTWAQFPAAQPWTFQGPNLLVEVKTWAGTFGNVPFRVDRCFESPFGEIVEWGSNCGSPALSATSTNGFLPGGRVDIGLRGAAPFGTVVLFAGVDAVRSNGRRLPIDLGAIGLPGCHVSIDPLGTASMTADANGDVTASLSIPAGAGLGGDAVAFQWLYQHLLPSQVPSIAVSHVQLLTIGPRTCPNGYVYSLRSATATSGTVLPGGPVVRFGL